MKKEISITKSIILSFLLLSILSIFIILFVYILYSRGEGEDYALSTYVLSSLIFFKSYIPYVIALSVYLSFFKAKYLYQESISKVIAYPIGLIVLLVCFYAVYDYSFTNMFISKLKEYNSIRDAKIYYEYELKLKNEAYESAKEQLMAGNLDAASSLAEEALFYDNNDGNTLLLIKSIQKEKMTKEAELYKEKFNNITNLMSLGTREFSLSNYNSASKYFSQVLELDNNNPMALYYMNRINIAMNRKPLYYGNLTPQEASIYAKLSETIDMYESGYLWIAYENISKLYLNYPNIAEINNYYSIIRDAITRYNFFIKEAQEIREAYIDNTDLLKNSSSFSHNGINLMLSKNVLLSSASSAMFKNSLYMFDISLMELDDELKIVRCDNFLYGKIADSFNSTNNTKNIILKAYFDTNKNEYIYNDAVSKVIPINISYSTLDIIKNYTSINLKYVNLLELFTLRKEIQKIGYSDKDINFELLVKNIEPIAYLLLFMIIAYYSFRFRLAASTDKFHFYNRITGVLGTLLFVTVYKVLINYLAMLMLMASHITISVIIAVFVFAFLILYVIFQMARIPRDVR
ncbi:hypothetical protein BHAMNSH16_12175 [Brachyspira hampsonii]|uniref:Uncharacterized protein n=1 Tax=Brachyspira hampsonii TaxID=1287055 RepID=A0AAC9TX89_9SPIR|nr:hypothetical protein [Brachyspira hampsonii]ASJ22356.1 hypothetical protein BHAMNSH16_12175 [Brachyspira hampsonii]OEJ19213.1 hypothetical protein A9496_04870 [Brachyspira hampsonii]